MQNYHLVSAFVSAFNKSPILRLKHTKSKLTKRHLAILEDLETIMSMEKSYNNYRQIMKNAVPPLVPFLFVFLIKCNLHNSNISEKRSLYTRFDVQ